MATKTLGTNATTTLTAVQWTPGMSAADFASIANGILDDGAVFSAGGSVPNTTPNLMAHSPATSRGPIPGAFTQSGILTIPNRGQLRVLPGDWVGIDANGWPILVSSVAIAGGSGAFSATSWTHS